jgi:hypothetical protein
MEGLGSNKKQDYLTDAIRIRPTKHGAQLINSSPLGKHTPAVAGEIYIAPLWDLIKSLSRVGNPAEACVEDSGTFELLA